MALPRTLETFHGLGTARCGPSVHLTLEPLLYPEACIRFLSVRSKAGRVHSSN